MTTVLETVVLAARDHLLDALTTAPIDRDAMFLHCVAAFTDYLTDDRRRGRIMFVESSGHPRAHRARRRTHRIVHRAHRPDDRRGRLPQSRPGSHRQRPQRQRDLRITGVSVPAVAEGSIPVSRERFDEHAARLLTGIALIRSGPPGARIRCSGTRFARVGILGSRIREKAAPAPRRRTSGPRYRSDDRQPIPGHFGRE